MIRLFLYFFFIVALVVVGTTVKFGKRTLYGHIVAIWDSPATKDARDGIREKAGPVVKDVGKKAAKALDEATEDDDAKPDAKPGTGTGTGAPKPAPSKW